MYKIGEGRDAGLDILKVMATFAVLRLHSGHQGAVSAMPQYLCGFAIPVFFMVSGALLLNRREGLTASYVKRRIIRILGLMFAWNLILVVLAAVKKGMLVNPLEYFIQAMFQQGYLWHFWYLWSLVFLTALSPFIYKVLASKRFCKPFMMALLLVCFILSVATLYENGKYHIEIHVPQAFRLWSHLLYFCLGGVLYRYGKKERIWEKRKEHTGFVLFLLILFSVSAAFLQFKICYGTAFLSPEYCFTNFIIILYNVFLFSFVISIKGTGSPYPRALQAINADSLGIYILHPFLIGIFSRIGIWNCSYPVFNFLLLAFTSVLAAECMRRIPYLSRLIKL